MSQEQVNLDVTITDKDMFDFNLYHTYHSKNGWLAIIYAIDASGVRVTTDVEVEGDRTATLLWKQVYKVVHTRKALYIFSGKTNAYIIPNHYTEDNWNALSKIIVRNVEEFKRKL